MNDFTIKCLILTILGLCNEDFEQVGNVEKSRDRLLQRRKRRYGFW